MKLTMEHKVMPQLVHGVCPSLTTPLSIKFKASRKYCSHKQFHFNPFTPKNDKSVLRIVVHFMLSNLIEVPS